MSKENPKNREEAFAYQFEDDVKMLKKMSMFSKNYFDKALDILQDHIHAYNKPPVIKSKK